MVPIEVRLQRTYPSGVTPAAEQQQEGSGPMASEAEARRHRTDTLQIAVKAKEKVINYDSIFRSLSPAEKPGPATSAPLKSSMRPATGQAKEQEISPALQKTSHPGAAAHRDAPHGIAERLDLAARGIVTAGLTLILIAVVLELFLKRKGLVLLVTGMAALLTGLTLL